MPDLIRTKTKSTKRWFKKIFVWAFFVTLKRESDLICQHLMILELQWQCQDLFTLQQASSEHCGFLMMICLKTHTLLKFQSEEFWHLIFLIFLNFQRNRLSGQWELYCQQMKSCLSDSTQTQQQSLQEQSIHKKSATRFQTTFLYQTEKKSRLVFGTLKTVVGEWGLSMLRK